MIKLVFFKKNCLSLFLAVMGLQCCAGFSLIAVSRGYCNCGEPSSHVDDFSWCGAQALECRLRVGTLGRQSTGSGVEILGL